jgi:chromosome segregation ATPase
MIRTYKVFGFLLVIAVGIFGCSKGSNSASTGYGSNSTAEAKIHRLEEDYKAASAAREALRQKLAATEDQQNKLLKQLDQARLEGDALRADLKAKVSERDDVKSQYETFRRSIRDALGQAEAGAAVPTPNPNAGAAVSSPAATIQN